ncbi:MAG TPA: nucleotidyltransferase domain-containing protein [Anaerolineales bacterium]|nr:nucleotidyltransferase domain-containing protein [Anaerolineales bacterium]
MPDNIKKILRELKKGLVEIFGDQLHAVYLFGSFARGQGRLPDSDIDVMIVLNGEFNYREVERRSIDFVAALCLAHDVVIIYHFVSADRYAESQMPFMLNVRKDAVAL